MSMIIDRDAAIACVNAAEQKIGGISGKIQLLANDVGQMSTHLKGVAGSPTQQMYEGINGNLLSWLENFNSATEGVNEKLEKLINTGEEKLGPMVRLAKCDRSLINTADIKDGVVMTAGGYNVNTVGLTSIGDADSDFTAFTGHVEELSQDLENIIYDYKALWEIASQHTQVQDAAHEAATTIRMNASSISEEIVSFAKKYVEEAQNYDDKANTNAADVMSAISSMESKLNAIDFEMPISF